MAALLSLLWADRQLWQHRLVYRIALATTTHGRVSASYHVVVPPEYLELAGVAPEQTTVRALVPLTWRPKELLLNVALSSSSGGPVHLLTRADIGGLQSGIFVELLEESGVELGLDLEQVRDLVEAIARFMPRRVRAATDLTEGSSAAEIATRLRTPSRLASFLAAETGVPVTAGHVELWTQLLRVPERAVSAVMPGSLSAESSSENFLLALSEFQTRDVGDLDTAVRSYRELVLALETAGNRELLLLLGRLGREWTVIVDLDLDATRPVTITMEDDRPLGAVDVRRRPLCVPVPLEDGGSLHVETQLLDPSAQLKDVKVLAADGETPLPLSDDVRETHDRHAVYLSSGLRPARGVAQIQVELTNDVAWTNTAVLVLASVALVLSLFVDNTADILALLVIPTTLAVSIVQVRERTSIVRGLTASIRSVLFGVAIALWLVAALRLLLQSPDAAGLHTLLLYAFSEES